MLKTSETLAGWGLLIFAGGLVWEELFGDSRLLIVVDITGIIFLLAGGPWAWSRLFRSIFKRSRSK